MARTPAAPQNQRWAAAALSGDRHRRSLAPAEAGCRSVAPGCRVPPFVGGTRHPTHYFRKVNSALCVVPSSSFNENVAHFPAQDLSVFQT